MYIEIIQDGKTTSKSKVNLEPFTEFSEEHFLARENIIRNYVNSLRFHFPDGEFTLVCESKMNQPKTYYEKK